MRYSVAAPVVISLLASPLQAFAVPWTSDVSPPFTQLYDAPEPASRFRNVFPQLTWLRDTLIQSVFNLPSKLSTDEQPPTGKSSSSKLPETLLAKYGGDVVLRFNISTQAEEKALSEAADTLFLDVWEFTHGWADIRMREDDVRRLTPTNEYTTDIHRCHLYWDSYPNHCIHHTRI
jgi:extracellular matrix protein 14